MRSAALSSLSLITVCACLAQESSKPVPAYDRDGPLAVKTREHRDTADPKRQNRSVPLKVFYPDGPGPFPLVVFSHGGAGNWDSHVLQSKHLASHGYVVVAPTHIDSDNKRVGRYMLKDGMKFMEAIHQIVIDADGALQRPHDVRFAIDKMLEWNQSDAELKGRIDPQKIGIAGHSYGAYTTLVACGAQPIGERLSPRVPPDSERLANLSDPRIKAGVAYSPQGPDTTWFSQQSFGKIDRPLLCLSGTLDAQKSLESDGKPLPAEGRLEAFKLMPPKDKYFVSLENGDHMGFSENPNAKELIPSPNRSEMQRIARALTVVFFDVYLKGDKNARQYLGENYAGSLCGKLIPRLTWHAK